MISQFLWKPKRFAVPIHLLVVTFHLKTSVKYHWVIAPLASSIARK